MLRLFATILLASAALGHAAGSTDDRFRPAIQYWRDLSTPLVIDGVVYFGSTDGNLYAID